MQIKAVLENAQHPEYGQATVPLPIPKEEYGHVMELLAPLEIGSPVERDCKVEELTGAYPVFRCLEGQQVNVDELDYLMKLADSFFGGEDAQYVWRNTQHTIEDWEDFIPMRTFDELVRDAFRAAGR